jgi:hypothetical protein
VKKRKKKKKNKSSDHSFFRFTETEKENSPEEISKQIHNRRRHKTIQLAETWSEVKTFLLHCLVAPRVPSSKLCTKRCCNAGGRIFFSNTACNITFSFLSPITDLYSSTKLLARIDAHNNEEANPRVSNKSEEHANI